LLLAKTFSAYVARQFFAWFCGVFLAMVFITFLLDYIELIRRGGAKLQATLLLLFEMAALKLPHTAQEVLPFAILFGTMLVVARAAGVSVWQFLTPALIVAVLIGIIAVTVFNPIASFTQAAYEKLEGHILRQGSDQLSLSNSGLWLRQSDQHGDQIVIHAGKTTSQQLILDPVTLFFFNGETQFTARIDAEKARLESGDWVIQNGVRWSPNEPPQAFEELRLETTLTPRKIEESFADPDTMSFWDLPEFISLLEQSGFSAQRHRLQFNVLLARPFLLCTMVLVAATFSLRMQRRGGATLMIVSGVITGFLLYFLSDVIFALGLSAKVPVTLAAWTPTGVSLVFGTSMLLHLEDG
jgi:lipopolysaccharide export system permease protein